MSGLLSSTSTSTSTSTNTNTGSTSSSSQTQIPPYNYSNFINNYSELGVSSGGTFNALDTDVHAIENYVQLLLQGGGPASKTGGPLGNKYLYNSNSTCVSPSGQTVARYMYIDNVPSGTGMIPGQGLIPGLLDSITNIGVPNIMNSFNSGPTVNCQEVTLYVIDSNGNESTQTQYVAGTDLQNIPAYDFIGGVVPPIANPAPSSSSSSSSSTTSSSSSGLLTSKELFGNMNNNNNNNNKNNTHKKKNILERLFLILILLLGLYILYLMINKNYNH
jgi:hypothetical protein